MDGGFTGPTAWTLIDYKGQPGFRGKGRYTDAELQAMVDTAASLGWQVGLHAIGDAAIQQTIIAYDKALAKYPGSITWATTGAGSRITSRSCRRMPPWQRWRRTRSTSPAAKLRLQPGGPLQPDPG